MLQFLDSNPGLASRFGKTLNFSKWDKAMTKAEVIRRLSSEQFDVDEKTSAALDGAIESLIETEQFASGRSARTFVERIVESQARRLSKDPEASLTRVVSADIESALQKITNK